MLADLKGIIQTDGYTVYDSLYGSHPNIHLTFYMAHARRKFVDALRDDQQQANHMLDKMQILYALEQRIRDEDLDWNQRALQRKEHAMPVLERIGDWPGENQYRYRPQSPMGKAIAYSKARWTGLRAYALHGQMEIDNILVENAVRLLAIGRKAYLFVGSH